jgi:hypothetical protein
MEITGRGDIETAIGFVGNSAFIRNSPRMKKPLKRGMLAQCYTITKIRIVFKERRLRLPIQVRSLIGNPFRAQKGLFTHCAVG